MRRPSHTQLRALEDIRDHGDPGRRVFGQSAHGGANGTRRSLVARGWAIQSRQTGKWTLTDAGRKLLQK